MIEEQGKAPPVSEFDDHALWMQTLDDYRISEKFIKLSQEQQQIVLDIMNEHLEYIQEMTLPPEVTNDPNQNPELTSTTAAQEEEARLLEEAPNTAPEMEQQITQGV
jgi:hypothetical protein